MRELDSVTAWLTPSEPTNCLRMAGFNFYICSPDYREITGPPASIQEFSRFEFPIPGRLRSKSWKSHDKICCVSN